MCDLFVCRIIVLTSSFGFNVIKSYKIKNIVHIFSEYFRD